MNLRLREIIVGHTTSSSAKSLTVLPVLFQLFLVKFHYAQESLDYPSFRL